MILWTIQNIEKKLIKYGNMKISFTDVVKNLSYNIFQKTFETLFKKLPSFVKTFNLKKFDIQKFLEVFFIFIFNIFICTYFMSIYFTLCIN